MRRRGLPPLLIPAAGIALIVIVLALRRPASSPGPERTPAPPPVASDPPAPVSNPATPPPSGDPPPAPVKAAPPVDAARAAELKLLYDNYRTALLTDDAVLQEAVLPALIRDRENVLRMAQEDLRRARTPADQEVARRMLKALKKSK